MFVYKSSNLTRGFCCEMDHNCNTTVVKNIAYIVVFRELYYCLSTLITIIIINNNITIMVFTRPLSSFYNYLDIE